LPKPAVLLEIADALKLDREDVSAAFSDAATKARLKAEIDLAEARGVFGSPFFIVEGEGFWGNDRLPQLERWLARPLLTCAAICVFCGSRPGVNPAYRAAAESLGKTFAERGIELVYGGGNVGLMGIVADACLAAGGKVVGVIPRALLEWEVGHEGLSRLEVVDSMHSRKARMAELADGFIALPGGLGTFEELFEILTWAQLGFHNKPVALLNCRRLLPASDPDDGAGRW
jgi:uncharacterized protein (TIGR00730 family)